MSWSDSYPIFDETREISPDETGLAGLFEIERTVNTRPASHIVSTSLYSEDASRHRNDSSDLTGLKTGLQSWEPDFRLLVERTAQLGRTRPDVVVRVYLSKDLEMLCDGLVDAGCEVLLMETASDGHCPGAMWKFLALEEQERMVTILEVTRCSDIESNIFRTEETVRAGLGAWRIPGGSNYGRESYLPIIPYHFGSVGGYPMKELMQRFIASSIAGQAPGFAQFGEETIHLPNSEWPGTGFEGWFLLAAMYPRMAMKGFITFVSLSTQASSHSMLLDIEYATWANPESEVLFFRETAASPDGESSSRAEKDLVLCTRPDSDIILRHRPSRKGSDYSIHPHLREIALAEHECSVIASMDWASMNSKATWWIDVDRSLQPRGSRAELGIDRHLESVHLAVCGWRFISLKHEDAVWAVSRGADSGRWVEGAALKVPKLDGAITLWNATSARGVLQTWREEGRPVEFELFLERMRETGELAVVQLSASAQGWQTR